MRTASSPPTSLPIALAAPWLVARLQSIPALQYVLQVHQVEFHRHACLPLRGALCICVPPFELVGTVVTTVIEMGNDGDCAAIQGSLTTSNCLRCDLVKRPRAVVDVLRVQLVLQIQHLFAVPAKHLIGCK